MKQNETSLKIVNGTTANIRKYPFFASLNYKGSKRPFCGAAFIGGKENCVITAAHCLEGIKPNEIQVAFNKSFINFKGLVYNVRKILIHPKYDNITLDYDIALIYLTTRPNKKKVKPINIPNNTLGKLFTTPDHSAFIIGFGDTKYGGKPPARLQYGQVKIIDKNNKVENRYYPSELTSRMILAGNYRNFSNPNDNIDTCQGDSGGPLFEAYKGKWYLVGLTSWGYDCAWTGYPGVYTNVYLFNKWIKINAKI